MHVKFRGAAVGQTLARAPTHTLFNSFTLLPAIFEVFWFFYKKNETDPQDYHDFYFFLIFFS